MCRLSTCCCCCSLETGGYIIGWFNIIGSGIAVIGCITWIILLSIGAVHLDDVKLDGVDTGAIIGGFIGEFAELDREIFKIENKYFHHHRSCDCRPIRFPRLLHYSANGRSYVGSRNSQSELLIIFQRREITNFINNLILKFISDSA